MPLGRGPEDLPNIIGAYEFGNGSTDKVVLGTTGQVDQLQDFDPISIIQVVYPTTLPAAGLRTNFYINGSNGGFRQLGSSTDGGVNALRMNLDRATASLSCSCTKANLPYADINKWCVWAATVHTALTAGDQKLYGGDLQHALTPVTTYAAQTLGSGAVTASTNNADTVIGGTGGANAFAGAIAITAVWNKYLTRGQLVQYQWMLLSGIIPPGTRGAWFTGAEGPFRVTDLTGSHNSRTFNDGAHASAITGISMVRGFKLRRPRLRFLVKAPIVDQTIWQLNAMTAPTTDDLLVAVDDPSGTPVTKKLTLANFGTLTVSNVVVQTKTVGSGTYTPTAGMKAVLAIGVGGGGGGAGGIATDSAGGGGGGGGTCIRLLTAAQIGASKAYVVGAKGTGQTASGPNNATAGTATTLDAAGALLNAGGGGAATEGAGFTVVGVTVAGGTGGTAANGDLNIPGEAGERGTIFSGTTGQGGRGGRSRFGFGGASGGVDVAGSVGQAYGGGGAGGHAAAATNRNGADGADGILYLIEFIG